MALIYIVEDDENIREIETIALKTAIIWSAHLKRQLHFIKNWRILCRIWCFWMLCFRMRVGMISCVNCGKSCDKEIAGHYGDGKDRRNGYDQRSGRRGR